MISIAILGSGVPPDLLTTTNNVVDNFSDNSSNFSLIKMDQHYRYKKNLSL